MASTPTARNRLEKQGTGDNPGTWGVRLNNSALDMADEALDGVVSVTLNSPVTLSSADFVTDQSRHRILKCSGAGDIITIPNVQKWYIVHNNCASAVTIKTSAGAGAGVAAGNVTFVYCDGVSCFSASNMWPISNGTAAAPSIYFSTDADTGLYLVTANQLGISAGGARIVTVNTAGVAINGLITNTENILTTKSANTAVVHGVTNSNAGAAAQAQMWAKNTTNRTVLGRRGAAQTVSGALTAGAGYVYSDDLDLVLFAGGVSGRLVFAVNEGEVGRVSNFGSGDTWRIGRDGFNYCEHAAGLSLGYLGDASQIGIALRPMADETAAVLIESAAGDVVGTIWQSASGTIYNTTSDYRLKNEIVDLRNSGAFIDALRPREWRWVASGERGAGFVAHEAQAVSPSSVTGEKDAVGDGGVPLYQGMMAGSSEIIANLVAQVQELRSRLAALEAR